MNCENAYFYIFDEEKKRFFNPGNDYQFIEDNQEFENLINGLRKPRILKIDKELNLLPSEITARVPYISNAVIGPLKKESKLGNLGFVILINRRINKKLADFTKKGEKFMNWLLRMVIYILENYIFQKTKNAELKIVADKVNTVSILGKNLDKADFLGQCNKLV